MAKKKSAKKLADQAPDARQLAGKKLTDKKPSARPASGKMIKSEYLSLAELRSYEPHLALTHIGEYEAYVLVFSAGAASVRSILPSGVELRPQSITTTRRHPVLVFAGQQMRVRGIHVPGGLCPLLSPIGLCMNFQEAALAIPFVQQTGAIASTPDHFCAIKIYLDAWLPIFLGWLCGFPKALGILSQTTNTFDLKSLTGSPLLNLGFTATGPFQAPSTVANFAIVRPMLEQPHLGQLFSLSTPLLNTFLCAAMDMNLNTAQIQPGTVTGSLTSQFSAVLPPSFSLQGIDQTPLGAFRLRTVWELPPPDIC